MGGHNTWKHKRYQKKRKLNNDTRLCMLCVGEDLMKDSEQFFGESSHTDGHNQQIDRMLSPSGLYVQSPSFIFSGLSLYSPQKRTHLTVNSFYRVHVSVQVYRPAPLLSTYLFSGEYNIELTSFFSILLAAIFFSLSYRVPAGI
jgi:hypothetical protein